MGEAVRYYLSAKADILTIRRAQQAWKAANPFWNAIPISRVDKAMAQDYRDSRSHCKAVTVRNELAVIRAALNLCEEDKLITKAPFIKMPMLPQAGIRHLTKQQARKLRDGAGAPHVGLFIDLALATGSRMTALLELTWDRVDMKGKRIDLNPAERVQTSKGRPTVPINDQLHDALVEAKTAATTGYVIEHNGGRVHSVRTGWAAAVRRSGVKATPHMLRHSAAVWMAEAGQSMEKIAAFLGHTDSRITARVYARFSPDFLRGAAETLTY